MDLELVKTVGSIVGLLTGAFTVWDRFIRGRPLVFLRVTRDSGGTRKLCIVNRAAYDVAILKVKIHPEVYKAAYRGSSSEVLLAQFGHIPCLTIAPKDEATLHLVPQENENGLLELADQYVRFTISWRRGSSLWLPTRPAWLWANTRHVRHLARELPDPEV